MIPRILMTLILAALATPWVYAADAADEDSVAVQAAREKWVKNKGYKVYYTKKFDLSDLPHYKPEQKVSGTIRMWGSNYFTDSPLADYWIQEFQKYQPDVKFDLHLKTTLHAIPGLIFGMSDIGPMGRQITWDELLSYQRERNHLPVGIVAVTGSYDVSGWNPPIGVYLHKDNPLSKLSLQQLDGIFGAQRSAAWRELTWDKSLARGPEKNIRTWGQLGLTGEWADKPIHVYGFNLRYNTATDFADKVLKASDKWNENIHAYAHIVQPDGKRYIQADQITDALARDKYGIAYNRYRGERPNIRRLAVAATDGGPFVEHALETVQNRTYPLFQEAYFYTSVKPGTAIDPNVKEFLRYVLSQEGQAEVQRDGKYLPLTAEVVRAQLKKLDEAR